MSTVSNKWAVQVKYRGEWIDALAQNLRVGDVFRLPDEERTNKVIEGSVRYLFGRSIVTTGLQGVNYLIIPSNESWIISYEIGYITLNEKNKELIKS